MHELRDDITAQAASWFARLRAPDGAGDRRAFETWRSADERHAEAYADIERNWRRSAVLRDSALLDSFRLTPPWWRRMRLDRPRVLAPAFALLVLCIILSIWVAGIRWPVAPAMLTHASGVGQIRTLALADGSRVTLDTDSAITETFSAGERRVRLDRGRARFDVVHDAGRPFVVTAGTAQITDKGTVFDVRLADQRVEVMLLRGVVEVRSSASAPTASHVASLRTPGQKAVVTADRALVSSTRMLSGDGWVTGMLNFDDATLADMLAELNRYSTRRILLGDRRLAALRVTGAYRTDAPGDIARNLGKLFDLTVRADPQGNWILASSSARSVATERRAKAGPPGR